MPTHLGIFDLSHSKRNMNKFVIKIEGIYSHFIYYQDTDPLYVHMDCYRKLKDASFVGNKTEQSKDDYGYRGIFNGFLHAAKMKFFSYKKQEWTTERKKNF